MITMFSSLQFTPANKCIYLGINITQMFSDLFIKHIFSNLYTRILIGGFKGSFCKIQEGLSQTDCTATLEHLGETLGGGTWCKNHKRHVELKSLILRTWYSIYEGWAIIVQEAHMHVWYLSKQKLSIMFSSVSASCNWCRQTSASSLHIRELAKCLKLLDWNISHHKIRW